MILNNYAIPKGLNSAPARLMNFKIISYSWQRCKKIFLYNSTVKTFPQRYIIRMQYTNTKSLDVNNRKLHGFKCFGTILWKSLLFHNSIFIKNTGIPTNVFISTLGLTNIIWLDRTIYRETSFIMASRQIMWRNYRASQGKQIKT